MPVSPSRPVPPAELEQALLGFFPGNSRRIRRLRREFRSVLHGRGPLVLAGESGTGKDHAARIIHHFLAGPDVPFVRIGPGAGAPPARSASTVYLDGGDTAPGLLEACLEECLGAVNPEGRFILALTTSPEDDDRRPPLPPGLPEACPVLHLPSLRHCREDLPLIMGQLCLLHRSEGPMRLDPADLHHLYTHAWPGNLDELWAWMEEKLAPERGDGGDGPTGGRPPLGKLLDREIDGWVGHLLEHSPRSTGVLEKVVGKVERCVLKAVLDRNGGRQVESARILGINRNTLAHKIKEHGLTARSRRRTPPEEQEPPRAPRSGRRRS